MEIYGSANSGKLLIFLKMLANFPQKQGLYLFPYFFLRAWRVYLAIFIKEHGTEVERLILEL